MNWILCNNKICTLCFSFHTETPIIHVWTLLWSIKEHGLLSMFSLQLLLAKDRFWTFTMYSNMIFNRLFEEQHSINNKSINSRPAKNWHLTTIIYIMFAYYIDEKSWVLTYHGINTMHMGNLFCSHQGPLAGSTPDPNRRYATLPHNSVSRTSSAPSPSLQRRISTNTSSSFYLKNKGRRFNLQLKKGQRNQWIPLISSLSDSYTLVID